MNVDDRPDKLDEDFKEAEKKLEQADRDLQRVDQIIHEAEKKEKELNKGKTT